MNAARVLLPQAAANLTVLAAVASNVIAQSAAPQAVPERLELAAASFVGGATLGLAMANWVAVQPPRGTDAQVRRCLIATTCGAALGPLLGVCLRNAVWGSAGYAASPLLALVQGQIGASILAVMAGTGHAVRLIVEGALA